MILWGDPHHGENPRHVTAAMLAAALGFAVALLLPHIVEWVTR